MRGGSSFHFIFHFLFHLILHNSSFHFIFHYPYITPKGGLDSSSHMVQGLGLGAWPSLHTDKTDVYQTVAYSILLGYLRKLSLQIMYQR